MQPNLRVSVRLILFLALAVTGTALAQQPDPFGAGRAGATMSSDGEPSDSTPLLVPSIDEGLKTRDSVVYRLARSSRLQVKTGKAGLFGFAGHTHVIEARGFTGEVVYYPGRPSSSRLAITVSTDSLEVLTPPDTAEIRKVGESMRTKVDEDPMCDWPRLGQMAAMYLAGADPRTPLASPLYADLRGLPPLLVHVGTAETLLDDATRLATRARAAGVDVTIDIWLDMIHVFHAFALMLPEAREAIEQIGAFLRRHWR